ncbi:hypothetical protein [Nocardioides plantarum]|uniref:Uncharacterized protein n=1 Tax=Nocardioides plantarum TaxID=29299 RepID=A0ABV5KEY3_9ACTN|nr:hypothetical protein [Nocardioides plantarum]
MSQPLQPPLGTTPPPVVPATPVTPVMPVAPAIPVVDDAAARAQLEDLQLQESVVAQLLDVLDDAGRQVSTGAPQWIDPDVFGGTREGERMARHTVRAQVRVQQALDQALDALAQHHVALSTFREEVRRVEATTEEQLAAVRARITGVVS